jgi:hypothetical protein
VSVVKCINNEAAARHKEPKVDKEQTALEYFATVLSLASMDRYS